MSQTQDLTEAKQYTLLFDGQCVICRHLVKTFVETSLPKNLSTKAYQLALEEGNYPKAELERCYSEIVLVNETDRHFFSGVEALSQTLKLINKLPLLSSYLKFSPLKPINNFFYRFIAWHRYSWFIVPPHLRCVECELKIPILWNLIFFLTFSLLALGASYANSYFWLQPLSEAAPQIFATIKKPFWSIPLLGLAASSIVFGLSSLISFASYKKVLGINKSEILKQNLLINAITSLIICALSPALNLLAFQVAPLIGGLMANLTFTLLTASLILGLSASQMFTFMRWKEIGFSPFKAVPILILDGILRAVAPILVLRYC